MCRSTEEVVLFYCLPVWCSFGHNFWKQDILMLNVRSAKNIAKVMTMTRSPLIIVAAERKSNLPLIIVALARIVLFTTWIVRCTQRLLSTEFTKEHGGTYKSSYVGVVKCVCSLISVGLQSRSVCPLILEHVQPTSVCLRKHRIKCVCSIISVGVHFGSVCLLILEHVQTSYVGVRKNFKSYKLFRLIVAANP